MNLKCKVCKNNTKCANKFLIEWANKLGQKVDCSHFS